SPPSRLSLLPEESKLGVVVEGEIIVHPLLNLVETIVELLRHEIVVALIAGIPRRKVTTGLFARARLVTFLQHRSFLGRRDLAIRPRRGRHLHRGLFHAVFNGTTTRSPPSTIDRKGSAHRASAAPAPPSYCDLV